MLATKRARWMISTIADCLRINETIVEVFCKYFAGFPVIRQELVDAGELLLARRAQEDSGLLSGHRHPRRRNERNWGRSQSLHHQRRPGKAEGKSDLFCQKLPYYERQRQTQSTLKQKR
jgi:hypothetical protein